MSGPYINGLGRRRQRKRGAEVSTDEEENEDFFSYEDGYVPKKKRRVSPSDAELVPKFRPDETSNVSGWLHKIDQLGDIYGWRSIDRQYIMQLRLCGSARDWYDDLEDYNLTWDQWKTTLKTAFPRSTDFVDRLEVMLARKKKDTEGMTKYYHTKLSLLKKCNIDGEEAISCIIRGLPAELRANAKAYNCDTPEQLYYGYLSSLENFKRVEAARSEVHIGGGRSTWRRGTAGTSSSGASTQLHQPKICYVCRRPGHEARDCRTLQHCETCQRAGHTSATCWSAAGRSQQQTQKVGRILAITYDIYLDIYRREVLINK